MKTTLNALLAVLFVSATSIAAAADSTDPIWEVPVPNGHPESLTDLAHRAVYSPENAFAYFGAPDSVSFERDRVMVWTYRQAVVLANGEIRDVHVYIKSGKAVAVTAGEDYVSVPHMTGVLAPADADMIVANQVALAQ